MTVEQVKSNLKNVRGLKLRMFALEQRIRELEEDIAGLSAVDYSKNKVKSSRTNYVEERYLKSADRLKELKDEYDLLFKDLCELEDELGERMKRLNPTEYKIIYERFMHGLHPVSINNMARKLGNGYSVDMVKKAQQRAFKKMADEL